MPTKKPLSRFSLTTLFVFGVIFPVVVIVLEISFAFCAEALFDPLPTLFHTALVCLVPLSNFLMWWNLQQQKPLYTRHILWLAAFSIAVAGFYTLIFLPILPIAAIAILYLGFGLLPFGPLSALLSGISLYRRLNRKLEHNKIKRRHFWLANVLGLLLLSALDAPTAITNYGMDLAASKDKHEQQRGINLLRHLGDRELMLRKCYSNSNPTLGPLSFITNFFISEHRNSPADARTSYYRVTGEPFNLAAIPHEGSQWRNFRSFRFDSDMGGTRVGGRQQGLALKSSRLDGVINAEQANGYLEWTFVVSNAEFMQQEARLQLVLPPGGVVSRATLWINGEEREAAYASKGKVREAYQRVVRVRRDPLLVTPAGSERVMLQAFPVPANGEMKFKVGITAPLSIAGPQSAALVLPAIVDRNFNIEADFTHKLWVESKAQMRIDASELSAAKVNANVYRIQGELPDSALVNPRKAISLSAAAFASSLLVSGSEGEAIEQTIVEKITEVGGLFIVIDGSRALADSKRELIDSLDHLPLGLPVGIAIGGEKPERRALLPLNEQHKTELKAVIKNTDFIGGQTNSDALTQGLLELEKHENPMLLWIHGPQPVDFGDSEKLLQATERLTQMPEVVDYSVEAGPNQLLQEGEWSVWSRHLPLLHGVGQDLRQFFVSINRSQWTIRRSIKADGEETGSTGVLDNHVARLWAYQQVIRALRAGDRSEKVLALAVNHRLVTPISGAVVLESEAQYEQNDLSPVTKDSVPTIPEPHEWILLLIVLAALLWFIRNKPRLILHSR
ncbi:hypothetical protein SAMN02745866_01068 [Alteromonadaceae bacterium Bs31]|nr:hypothetical protein SAMN02745866_01068 [Alteromonadaceae bacterium Bs31]